MPVCLAKVLPRFYLENRLPIFTTRRSPLSKDGSDGATNEGETDDIYKFIERSGNYYVSLLACGPPNTTTVPSGLPKLTLF
jgi:hypothetical protein